MTASTERTTPLAGHAALLAGASTTPSRFAMREIAFLAQWNLRLDPTDAALAAAVREALGFDLPLAANTWSGEPGRGALWLGPDEWLVVAPDAGRATLEASLRAALANRHHSLVDVSASRAVIELSGSDARTVLAKGCALPLHAGAFSPPQSAQTLLARSQVLLQCCDAAPVLRLFVRNSFTHYVALWLADAAMESSASASLDAERIAARLAGA